MSTETNIALSDRLTDASNRCDAAQLREVLAPDFVAHIAGSPQPLNREQYIEAILQAQQAFTGQGYVTEDVIADGDKVVLRGKIQLKHTGEFMGQAPTGNQIQFDSIIIRRIADGTIAEEWQVTDRFAFLRQLGLIPAPKP